jgi:hypothetical protein
MQNKRLPRVLDYWETLRLNDNYMIYSTPPHPVKKVLNGQIIKERKDKSGYITINLKDNEGNKYKYGKHVLIATQWISNPDNLPVVDHYDHNRENNSIENLHWASQSYNSRNLKEYKNGGDVEYLDDIPDDAVVIDHYNQWRFTNYFYWDNKLLYFEPFIP